MERDQEQKIAALIDLLYKTPLEGESRVLIPIVGGPHHGQFVETNLLTHTHEAQKDGQIHTYVLTTSEDGMVYQYKEPE